MAAEAINASILDRLHNLTSQDSFQRGSRYEAYANLRESMLRMKKFNQFESEDIVNLTPVKKNLKYQVSLPTRRKTPSFLAQSVPDFSSVIRKENRKPMAALPPLIEKSATPPPVKRSYGTPARLAGSKSAGGGEKRNLGVLGARKSYANMDELKGLASAASSAINGENRGLRSGRVLGKTVLGYRQY